MPEQKITSKTSVSLAIAILVGGSIVGLSFRLGMLQNTVENNKENIADRVTIVEFKTTVDNFSKSLDTNTMAIRALTDKIDSIK